MERVSSRPGRIPLLEPDANLPWREKLRLLSVLPRLLGLVWEAHRPFTAAMIFLRLARGVVPVATLWVGKLIIDAVIASAGGAPTARLWDLVALELGIVLLGELL